MLFDEAVLKENPEDIKNKVTLELKQIASRKYSSYFKYFSDDDIVFESIFTHQKIRFTQPRAFNDPLEFYPSLRFHDDKGNYQFFNFNGITFPSVELFYRVQIIESQINSYGILSLTKIPDSFDMWSQYANGHKGFVIEFKPDFSHFSVMKSKSGKEYPIKEVNYVDDYVLNLDDLVDKNREIPIQVIHDELFFKKTSRWKDEHEYRMIRPLSDHPDYKPPKINLSYTDVNKYLFPFSWECVSSIILGASMLQEKKDKIIQCCYKNNITVFQSYILRDQKDRFGKPSTIFTLLIDISNKGSLLKITPHVFCTDTISLSHDNGLEKITKLSDLPYYKGYEKVVEEYYHNKQNPKKPAI